jgi:hypothetical protein
MAKRNVYGAVWVVKDAHTAVRGYIQNNHVARQVREKDVHLGNVGLKFQKQVIHIRLGDLISLVEMNRIKRQKEQGANHYRRE